MALIAYDRLTETEKADLVELMKKHPRFDEDFEPPAKVNDRLRYQIGRLGYWPDVARKQPEFNRPEWHYDINLTVLIGSEDKIELPKRPRVIMPDDTLQTKDLHIQMALLICMRAMNDQLAVPADRALAMSWLAHLVGDAHQPCHAGSLYAERIFDNPEGDRGANGIKVTNGRNLHSLWDGLLGRRFDESKVRRVVADIQADRTLVDSVASYVGAKGFPDTQEWLTEGRAYGMSHVYTNEVLAPIRAASTGKIDELPEITLSQEYLQEAGQMARYRACQAGLRLAYVWSRCLQSRNPPRDNRAREQPDRYGL